MYGNVDCHQKSIFCLALSNCECLSNTVRQANRLIKRSACRSVQRQRRTTSQVRSRLLVNVCGEQCVQSQLLLNVCGRLRTQMLSERTADIDGY